MARAIDGIPDTARIRAMISLWQEDERVTRHEWAEVERGQGMCKYARLT